MSDPSTLTKDQQRRAEALKVSRQILIGTGLVNGGVVLSTEVIKLARYILTGDEQRYGR